MLLEMLGLGNKVIFDDDIRDDAGILKNFSTNVFIINMRAHLMMSETEIHALFLLPVTNGTWCLLKSTNGHIYYLAVQSELDTRYCLLVCTIEMIFLMI